LFGNQLQKGAVVIRRSQKRHSSHGGLSSPVSGHYDNLRLSTGHTVESLDAMIDHPDPAPLDTERLLADSVAKALEHEDPERFLAWFQGHLSDYFLGPQWNAFQDPGDAPRMAAVMGRSIWNAMPLPGNGLRPRPLPEPGRNSPCFCGSGRKYKRCCARMTKSLPLDSSLLMPMVLKRVSKTALADAPRDGRAPIDSLIEVAAMHAHEDKPRKAAEALEPLFEGPVRRHNEQVAYAMELLCEQYEHLGWSKKESALLNHVVNAAPRSPLRAGAWQRLATTRMDEADPAGAWEAFERARQDDPDAPGLALLEVQMLFFDNRVDEARGRAAAWERRRRNRYRRGTGRRFPPPDAAAGPRGGGGLVARGLPGLEALFHSARSVPDRGYLGTGSRSRMDGVPDEPSRGF